MNTIMQLSLLSCKFHHRFNFLTSHTIVERKCQNKSITFLSVMTEKNAMRWKWIDNDLNWFLCLHYTHTHIENRTIEIFCGVITSAIIELKHQLFKDLMEGQKEMIKVRNNSQHQSALLQKYNNVGNALIFNDTFNYLWTCMRLL